MEREFNMESEGFQSHLHGYCGIQAVQEESDSTPPVSLYSVVVKINCKFLLCTCSVQGSEPGAAT